MSVWDLEASQSLSSGFVPKCFGSSLPAATTGLLFLALDPKWYSSFGPLKCPKIPVSSDLKQDFES